MSRFQRFTLLKRWIREWSIEGSLNLLDTNDVSFHVCNRNYEWWLCFKFLKLSIWKMCVGYTVHMMMIVLRWFHNFINVQYSFFLAVRTVYFWTGKYRKKNFIYFFHKMMEFYKDLCFAWISHSYPKFRLTTYASSKYNRNIVELFECIFVDSFISRNE